MQLETLCNSNTVCSDEGSLLLLRGRGDKEKGRKEREKEKGGDGKERRGAICKERERKKDGWVGGWINGGRDGREESYKENRDGGAEDGGGLRVGC